MKFRSALVTAVSGSIGGLTGSHNRGGLYMRARTVPVNPQTAQQQAVRQYLAQLAAYWSDTLTQGQRDAWAAYADAVQYPDSLGEPRKVPPLAMFCACNVGRKQGGLSIVAAGPTTLVRATLTMPVATITAPTTLSLAFTNSDEWATASGGALLVYASMGTNPTVNYFKGPYRYLGKVSGAATPPTSPAALTLPFTVAAGQRVHLMARATNSDGRASSAARFHDDAA